MWWLYKKSEIGLGFILALVIVILFFGWLINTGQRECKSNRDCSSESYCGSDFSCHSYPTIQKTVIQYNLFWPAVIIAIAVVIAAWIFKGRELKIREEKEQHVEQKAEEKEPKETENLQPYYRSDSNARVP